MEENVPPDPHHVRFLGARAVMAGTDGSANAIQEFRRVAHAAEVPSAAMETQEIHRLWRDVHRECRIKLYATFPDAATA